MEAKGPLLPSLPTARSDWQIATHSVIHSCDVQSLHKQRDTLQSFSHMQQRQADILARQILSGSCSHLLTYNTGVVRSGPDAYKAVVLQT